MSIHPSPVFPLFIGSGRSGTTLLRNIFDSHPELAVTHEAHFVAPMAQRRSRYEDQGRLDRSAFVADLYKNKNFVRQGLDRADVETRLAAHPVRGFADAVRAVFALYAEREGKRLYGDKTPGYVNHIGLIAGLFPEVRFVHIIRDGRNVALGYLDRPEWGPSTVAEAALYWRSRVMRGRTAGARLGARRYHEVRYEALVDDPEGTTRDVCQFLGLDFHDAMLRFHERGEDFIATSNTPEAFGGLAMPVTKGMRNWHLQMSEGDVELFESIAGRLLGSLGYETRTEGVAPSVKVKAALAGLGWQVKRLEAKTQPLVDKVRRNR